MMNMESIIKKVLYTGVGIVAATTERLQHSIDELVEKGKLSEDEGKKVVDDVVKNAEIQRPNVESRFKKIVDAAFDKMNLPQNDAFSKMEKRIKSLEVKVGFLAKELKTLNANLKEANKEKK
jgi:polyhydroxyalkanoate synthesis regulator phasin